MSEHEVIEGELTAFEGMRIGIVAGRFNSFIVEQLLAGCFETLRRHGVAPGAVTVVKVPGAFEMPVAAKRMAASGAFDVIVALGAVIRGATPHFEHVAAACTRGLARVALDEGVPVVLGVLTVDTVEQAVERAGTKGGNKGAEAARAALEMAALMRKLGGP